MSSIAEVQQFNEVFFDQLNANCDAKSAINDVNDFVRNQMRKDGFYRRLSPFQQISDFELDRPVGTHELGYAIENAAIPLRAISDD